MQQGTLDLSPALVFDAGGLALSSGGLWLRDSEAVFVTIQAPPPREEQKVTMPMALWEGTNEALRRAEDRADKTLAAKEAYRYYVDASDRELAEAGTTREGALRRARDLDALVPPYEPVIIEGTN